MPSSPLPIDRPRPDVAAVHPCCRLDLALRPRRLPQRPASRRCCARYRPAPPSPQSLTAPAPPPSFRRRSPRPGRGDRAGCCPADRRGGLPPPSTGDGRARRGRPASTTPGAGAVDGAAALTRRPTVAEEVGRPPARPPQPPRRRPAGRAAAPRPLRRFLLRAHERPRPRRLECWSASCSCAARRAQRTTGTERTVPPSPRSTPTPAR